MKTFWRFGAGTAVLFMVAACVVGRPLCIASHWDNDFVNLWAKKAEQRGLTVGRVVPFAKVIESEKEIVAATSVAQRTVFRASYKNLRISDFQRVGTWYLVCITDGTGDCYFMTRIGEKGVAYYAIGTISE